MYAGIPSWKNTSYRSNHSSSEPKLDFILRTTGSKRQKDRLGINKNMSIHNVEQSSSFSTS